MQVRQKPLIASLMPKIVCNDPIESSSKNVSKEFLRESLKAKVIKNAKEELIKSKRNSKSTLLALKRSRRDKLLSAAYKFTGNTEKNSPIKRVRPVSQSNENRTPHTS